MSKNPHTGDEIKTKPSNSKYDEGWERIFGNKEQAVLCSICGKEVSKVTECERYSCPKMFGETT